MLESYEDEKFASEFIENQSSTILSRFGLSPNQERVYLFLGRNGSRTASQIANALKIPRTETYTLLKILEKKGCIMAKNFRPWRFTAVSVEGFLEKKIELERQKIQSLEDTLNVIKNIKMAKNVTLKMVC